MDSSGLREWEVDGERRGKKWGRGGKRGKRERDWRKNEGKETQEHRRMLQTGDVHIAEKFSILFYNKLFLFIPLFRDYYYYYYIYKKFDFIDVF